MSSMPSHATPSPVPEGHATFIPHLVVPDDHALIAFVEEAFEGTLNHRTEAAARARGTVDTR
ncbi:MAG: hypothetical protein EA352_08185 [Gemmatimonadales bacterium]|nr:MAG: hypothetical protein EA352_08185 [Gemmatimonadales bacterium]